MSEETKDSAPEPVNEEVPTPKFTEPSSGQPNSALDMDAIAEKVAERLRPTIEKTVQSTKDKRFKKLESLGLLDDLREQGVSIPENVELKMRLAALEGKAVEPIQGRVEPQSPQPVSQTVSEIVKEAELDPTDPRVVDWMRGTYRNSDHMRAEGLALKKKLASPPPNPSAVSPVAQPVPTPQKLTDAEVETKAGQLNNLYKNPSKYKVEIAALEKELEAYLPK